MSNENRQFDILTEVLLRFHKHGILDHLILVGSWSVYFYNIHFKTHAFSSELRTRDSDFLIPRKQTFTTKVSIPNLLEDLGFLTELRGQHGIMTLQHPELFIEFLTPEPGSDVDKPKNITSLGVKAHKLHHIEMLARSPLSVAYQGINVKVPAPSDFAIHKLILSEIRKNKDKRPKDFQQGKDLYHFLFKIGLENTLKESIKTLSKKEKKYLDKALLKLD